MPDHDPLINKLLKLSSSTDPAYVELVCGEAVEAIRGLRERPEGEARELHTADRIAARSIIRDMRDAIKLNPDSPTIGTGQLDPDVLERVLAVALSPKAGDEGLREAARGPTDSLRAQFERGEVDEIEIMDDDAPPTLAEAAAFLISVLERQRLYRGQPYPALDNAKRVVSEALARAALSTPPSEPDTRAGETT